MGSLIVGLFFVLFSYKFPFYSQNADSVVYVNIIPDVIGYLLLCFGLEKLSSVNRWFRDAYSVATGMLVVSFITFVSQISFLFSSYLSTERMKFAGILLALINYLVDNGESILVALNMLFMFFFCYSLGYYLQSREKQGLCIVMYVFTIAFTILTVLFAVNQFINLPFPLWIFSMPIGVVFMIFSYFITQMIDEDKTIIRRQ